MSSTWSPLLARLSHLLIERLHGRIILWPQNPLVIVPDSEPEPDIVLLGYRDDVSRQPQAGRFHHNVRVARGDALSPLAFPDTPLAVADILGRRPGAQRPPLTRAI